MTGRSNDKRPRWRTLALIAFAAVVLYKPLLRAADVWYKVGSVVVERLQGVPFPDKRTNFCKQPFCRRSDTRKRLIAGRRNYRSERSAFYCPLHEPGGFFRFKNLVGSFIWTWYFILIAALALLPAMILVALPFQRLEKHYERKKEFEKGERVAQVGYTLGLLAAGTIGVMYVLW